MFIRVRRGWEIPDRLATPESVYLNRRALLGAAGALGLAMARPAHAEGGIAEAKRNPRYQPGRAITPEADATTYNNYYEFSTSKSLWRAAQKLPQRPWTVKLDGLVDHPQELAIDELIARMPLEERVYRHRCVEAWSMVVPWTGFQLSKLMELVAPQAGAKYLRFETAQKPDVMPGLQQVWYPWPYVEACTMAEAANELAFLVVGAYGKPVPPQNGGPIRLHLPWKYGFKDGKSLVRISFVADRPKTYWETIQPSEYGFWANVNPEVPHPRWSQATERVLGTGERVPTQLFNGYGEFVADLYKGLEKERLWV